MHDHFIFLIWLKIPRMTCFFWMEEVLPKVPAYKGKYARPLKETNWQIAKPLCTSLLGLLNARAPSSGASCSAEHSKQATKGIERTLHENQCTQFQINNHPAPMGSPFTELQVHHFLDRMNRHQNIWSGTRNMISREAALAVC